MSGALPHGSHLDGAVPDRPSLAPADISGRPSGTRPCRAESRLPIHNNKTADPVHGSATTSIAAAGMPPEPHERDTVIVARPRLLGSCAYRMARYKVIRLRRTARNLRGDWSERDAPLRQAEGTGLSYTVTDRTRDAASQPLWGCPRSATVRNAGRGIALEGNAPPNILAGPVRTHERDSGRLAARRMRLIGRRLSAPTPGTSVPLPGSATGC